MNTLPREMLSEYRFCMSCGIEATHPYNIEHFNHGNNTFIYLRCTNCKQELRHERPLKKIKDRDRSDCKCGGKLYVKQSKKKGTKHLQKEYYYTHTLACTKCDRIYLDEKYKVYN